MIRKPTHEEAMRIDAILRGIEVRLKPEHFSWNGHKEEAYALLKALGHKPPTSSCFGCWVQGMNKLRMAINLPPIDHGAREGVPEARMAICYTCPAYHEATISCGRLIVDAISPKEVTDTDGKTITPCGCFLPAKTNLKHAHCPANKW